MRIVDSHRLAIEYASVTRKWVVLISWCIPENLDRYEEFFANLREAAPYLDPSIEQTEQNNHLQVLGDGYGFVICETEEEGRRIFDLTVGDDGPTELNPYNGPVRVYALLIGPEGALTENT